MNLEEHLYFRTWKWKGDGSAQLPGRGGIDAVVLKKAEAQNLRSGRKKRRRV